MYVQSRFYSYFFWIQQGCGVKQAPLGSKPETLFSYIFMHFHYSYIIVVVEMKEMFEN